MLSPRTKFWVGKILAANKSNTPVDNQHFAMIA